MVGLPAVELRSSEQHEKAARAPLVPISCPCFGKNGCPAMSPQTVGINELHPGLSGYQFRPALHARQPVHCSLRSLETTTANQLDPQSRRIPRAESEKSPTSDPDTCRPVR